jgi:hypothetical protein
MHRSNKPVRKCHGCGLNLADHCGIYESPHQLWQRHAVCPGFKNDTMLAGYLDSEAKKQAKLQKEKRRIMAQMRQGISHNNGKRLSFTSAVTARR